MKTTIKRHRYADYLNIGTAESPNWQLMGVGFKVLDENPGAQSETVRYVCDSGSSTETVAYQTEFPFEADQIIEEAAVMELYRIARDHKLGEDAEREYVRVELWNPGGGANVFAARKFTVSVEISSFSGENRMGISGTLHAVGDPVLGTFDTANRAFDVPHLTLTLDLDYPTGAVLGVAAAADLQDVTDTAAGIMHVIRGSINYVAGMQQGDVFYFVMHAEASGVPGAEITADWNGRQTTAQNGIIYMPFRQNDYFADYSIRVKATAPGADPVQRVVQLQSVQKTYPPYFLIIDPAARYGADTNPQTAGWYEESGSGYVLTADTSIVIGKRYFIQNNM